MARGTPHPDLDKIHELLRNGATNAEIGDKYGLEPRRVHSLRYDWKKKMAMKKTVKTIKAKAETKITRPYKKREEPSHTVIAVQPHQEPSSQMKLIIGSAQELAAMLNAMGKN